MKTIAREYTRRYSNLKDLCFIFPNKRCVTFFKKYFADYDIHTEDLPHILTITELMSQVARKKEASKIEQLFTLYTAYTEILGKPENSDETYIDFESFRGWGEIVLSDFNTVDQNLVDTEEIFKNIKDYREIASNFLTEDQKDVMREYFGIDDFSDSNEFWKNFDDEKQLSPLKQKFISLWQILSPLHKRFVELLDVKGLGSSGYISKEAAQRILVEGEDALPYKKVIMVGFNALNEAERSIFRKLQDCPPYKTFDTFVDFIWDATGPVLENEEFSASRFVAYNKKHFPSPQWLEEELEKHVVTSYPKVKIISAPSNMAQAKVAAEELRKYDNEDGKRMIAETEVALVLPDEGLINNVLYSIPDEINDINLTMGLSFKQTPIASFMSLFRRLYFHFRETKKGILFFVKDLKIFLSHPYSYILFGYEPIEKLLEYVQNRHRVSLYQSEIVEFFQEYGELLSLPSKKIKGTEIFRHLEHLFSVLKDQILENSDSEGGYDDIAQIKIYEEYLSELETAMKQYEIESSPIGILQIAEKLIGNEKIGFEGEPIVGLQVMGTLETRLLDFRHIIILSMNEGVMPQKAFSSTFIPESLRKAYGLPPARYAEEIFGYYFYRMISRAEKVTLIYDGRTVSGLKGGESRYLLQLRQYLPKDKLKEESWQYNLSNKEFSNASIEKTAEIKEMIKCFLANEETKKNLSSSSLNTYRECEVRFFLQNILNLSTDPEPEEFMDAITVGNILHSVMMQLYMPTECQKKLLIDNPVIIDKEKINSLLNNSSFIHSLIVENIREHYFKNSTDGETIKSGVTDIMAEQIESMVKEILKYDLKLTPFKLYGCEVTRNIKVTLANGREVNFRFAIDRFDEIDFQGEKRFRIVDYKTGSKKRKAVNLEEVFLGGYQSEQIFQLFTYAWLLGKIGFKGWEDVMTEIYFVPDLIKGIGGLPELEGEKVTSFRAYYEEFGERLEAMIESIFSKPAFSQPLDEGACRYCVFKSFCKK